MDDFCEIARIGKCGRPKQTNQKTAPKGKLKSASGIRMAEYSATREKKYYFCVITDHHWEPHTV
jgi:hypothetical protein